jgi:hypothetical protein
MVDSEIKRPEAAASPQEEIGRDRVLRELEKELVGPKQGEGEIVRQEKPNMRYTMGVLFPPQTRGEDAGEEFEMEEGVEKTDPASPNADEEPGDDPVRLAGQWMPASLGISFYFKGARKIEVEVRGAHYEETQEGEGNWARRPLTSEEGGRETVVLADPGRSDREKSETSVLEERAKVHVRWRPLGEGTLATVTLVNDERMDEDDWVDPSDCLYQVGFRCAVPEGTIKEYPSIERALGDEEDRTLDLLYRDRSTYAVGHGCAAAWEDGTPPASVETKLLPRAVVPDITHELRGVSGDLPALQIARLADEDLPQGEMCGDLNRFLDRYDEWIEALPEEHGDVPSRLRPARERIMELLRKAAARMRRGVKRLRSDETALKSFRLANRAMLMQMHHGSEELGGSRSRRNRAQTLPEDYDYLSLDEYEWRPFQLAFQLLTIEGICDYESEERDLVDLIWFPTGGGKTEAYLATAAFEILRRRLAHREAGAGTAVITRYTLRLLTSQQFQRSARLICALEILRRHRPKALGDTPISIGFWAGKGTSPNRYKGAVERLDEMIDSRAKNAFQVELCPWCGTEIVPEYREHKEAYGLRAKNRSFEMFCPTEDCAFSEDSTPEGRKGLPISVVDEDLYDHPPTFLIGTVDKFAMLAWRSETGAFFGRDPNRPKTLPPTLVIQDELHLLSGPLGTTAAVYEAGIQELMRHEGRRPKVVASTATIRSAGDQVESLFNRDVRLFPPSGLSADDSFFSRVDEESPGRLYVGVMSPHHRPSTSIIRTASGLLQAPEDLGDLSEIEDDVYRTLVIYHLSLRELGKTSTFAHDDIPARLDVITGDGEPREVSNVVELTSKTPSYEIPRVLEQLEKKPGAEGFADVLTCTNMISVGVDIDRLSLMILHGQPKTTSEYIQASSRVGREHPGLVVAHYSANKPRDRSHYEDFTAYHNSLYRRVEPTSVTPFSAPSRDRSLHAAFVLLVRHLCGLQKDGDAADFDASDRCIREAAEALLSTIEQIDGAEHPSAEKDLQKLIDEWDDAAQSGPPLRYDAYRDGKQFRSLLRPFGREHRGSGVWPTLRSMRNVGAESPIFVEGSDD